ncbi:MAG: hypothetical protein ACHQYQ_09780 [Bacteriovoracales bacterium]
MKISNLIKIILVSTVSLPILIASAGFFDSLKSTGEAQKAKKACENKDAKACYTAGKMFSENQSEAARKEGMIMFTKGCDYGDFACCEYLAQKGGDLSMAFKAGQLAKDKDGRRKWFGKVCLGGDLKGCEALCTRGIFDDELDGCLKLAENAGKKSSSNEANEEEIKWWLKSCDSGNTVGCGLAGNFIKDPIESTKLLEKACSPPQNFVPPACTVLGFRARESGDLKKAEEYYLKSCTDIFYEDSCEILKEIRKEIASNSNAQSPILSKLKAGCDNGDYNDCLQYGFNMTGPEDQKIPWFKKACDGRVSDGCFRMGLISNKENNFADTKKYFLLACDGGHAMACNNLGFMELQKGNQAEAVKYYSKACSGGATAGCNNLASIQIDWNNIAEARKYLNEACDSGSNAACQKLVALTKSGK